jgi:hypothetical protein
MPKILRQQLVIAAVAAVLALAVAWSHFQATRRLSFVASLQPETALEIPIFQVFYDIGKGFREADARSFFLPPGETPLSISFTIPGSRVHGLRLDILNGPGAAVLAHPALVASSGETVCPIRGDDVASTNQLASLVDDAGRFHLSTSVEANDPYLIIPFAPACESPVRQTVAGFFLFLGKVFVILFLGIQLLLLLVKNPSPPPPAAAG